MANPIAVAALVVLAGRLPGHTEPDSNFWPPDAQADGVVDEHRELRLCRLPREPDAFDPLQNLGRRQLRNSLRRCWRFRSFLVPWTWVNTPGPRLALRPTHATQHARQV